MINRELALNDYSQLQPVELDEYPDTLPNEAIRTCRHLFQHRNEETGYHVDSLIAMLKRTGRPLDPIMVWATDKGNVVLDGHHRLIAYEQACWTTPIPVEFHKGDSLSALEASIGDNIKDKLSMTANEKHNAAWRLVNMTKADGRFVYSKRKITELTGASNGLLGTMREVREKLLNDELSPSFHKSWAEARNSVSENMVGGDWDETKEEAQIEEWKQRLTKTFGRQPDKQPEVFARALIRYLGHTSSRVASHLVSEGYGNEVNGDLAFADADLDEEEIDF